MRNRVMRHKGRVIALLATALVMLIAGYIVASAARRSHSVQLGSLRVRVVDAAVIARDPNLWYQQVEVHAGSSDGVKPGDPVIVDGALVGEISAVNPVGSVVALITSRSVEVAARALSRGRNVQRGASAILESTSRHGLVLTRLSVDADIRPGDEVVATGFRRPHQLAGRRLLDDRIPIGRVGWFSQDQMQSSGEVPVIPDASIRAFRRVQLLTRARRSDRTQQLYAGQRRARGRADPSIAGV